MPPSVQLGNRQIVYWEDRPPVRPIRNVLWLHGVGGHSGQWRAQLQACAAVEHRGIAWNLPGRGGSRGPAPGDVEEMAALALELAEHLQLPRFVLGGSDVGGMAALAAAARRPERLRGVILVAAAARQPVGPEPARALGQAVPPPADTVRSLFGGEWTQPLLDELAADWEACPPPARVADLRACEGVDLSGRLGEVAVPVLVVIPTGDRFTLPEEMERTAAGLPGAEVVTVAGAGHQVQRERPDAVNEAVKRFLRRLG